MKINLFLIMIRIIILNQSLIVIIQILLIFYDPFLNPAPKRVKRDRSEVVCFLS